jgi:DNA-binding CsgD family transcriptional regulator
MQWRNTLDRPDEKHNRFHPMETCDIHHLLGALNLLYDCRSAEHLPETVKQVLTATVPCDLTAWFDADETCTVHSYSPRLRSLAQQHPDFDRLLQENFSLHPFTSYILAGGGKTVVRPEELAGTESWQNHPLTGPLAGCCKSQYMLCVNLRRPGNGFIALAIGRDHADFSPKEIVLIEETLKHIHRHAVILGLLHADGLESPMQEQCFCQKKLMSAFGLTARESEVAYWAAHGKTNQDIAVILSLSPHTVRTHLQRIFEKMMVETRAALAHTIWHL